MDLKILYLLQNWHRPSLDILFITFTKLGDAGLIWILLAGVLSFQKSTRKIGFSLILGLLMMFIIGDLTIKPLVARIRPLYTDSSVSLLIRTPKGYSFPSGHAYAAFVSATILYLYKVRYKAIVVGLACMIAFSRLYLFVHYPTDVLAGVILGILTGIGVYRFVSSKEIRL